MLMKFDVCGLFSRIRILTTVNPMANSIAATVPPSRSFPRSSKAVVVFSWKLSSRGNRFIAAQPFASAPSGPGIDAGLDTGSARLFRGGARA